MNWFWTKEMSSVNPYYQYIMKYYPNINDDHMKDYWNNDIYTKNNWKEQYNS